MIDSTSTFIRSAIPLYHNAVKSIIFKCAELLMGIFIFKFFSLIAARSNQFTSYLMFTEDYIQRTLFITSRGFSRAAIVVLFFSLLNIVVSLYGTLLWALDSPGYIFQASNATISDYEDQRNVNPPYIIQLSLAPDALPDTDSRLPQIIGADLMHTGLNYTLTGKIDNYSPPNVVAPTQRDGVGARIWLDGDGLSVSPDGYAMFPLESKIDDEVWPVQCVTFDKGAASWNCTFSNVFSLEITKMVAGQPEVHWNDATDKVLDTRYIRPNRVDNIWISFGAGGGSAVMNQVFTVTRKTRRHTFSQSTFKATMLASGNSLFDRKEVTDLVERTWSPNITERTNPLIGQIVDGMMSAQSRNKSFHFGGNNPGNDKKSVAQSNWGMYTLEVNGNVLYSLISITTTNITLIRSETIAEAPIPYQKCDRTNFQNEAFGGKVTQTDCEASKGGDGSIGFFGQVDTAVVMIAQGLGDGRSNLSAASLDNDVLNWVNNKADALESLLIARAYAVSIDPSLVEITVDRIMVAMSYLQLYLSCFALFLAIILWLGLMIFADAHWASSLLANLINTTSEPKKNKPGYITRAPEVTLQSGGQTKKSLAIDGMPVTLYHAVPPMQQRMASPAPYGEEGKSYMETGVHPVGYNDPTAGRQGPMAGYAPVYPNTR
ncbi:hypothetical protein BKA59DRAFT_487625 [Fusarium tricinctum]|uniref:Uncharacterized protein n=1 Tax=Fusarium tricinctum TaxID=61284 RepID=A0A8K0W6A2_9HYPO|nr:hypothetical protein BKA59DRAFT_487625 [Fusarium tricinctum]